MRLWTDRRHWRIACLFACCSVALLLVAGTVLGRGRSGSSKTPSVSRATAPTTTRQLGGIVRKSIYSDPGLSLFNVQVLQSTNGLLMLQGNVDTNAQRDAIGTRAAQIAGAENIVNDISIGPSETNSSQQISSTAQGSLKPGGGQGQSPQDIRTAAEVRRTIYGDPALSLDNNVQVSVLNGRAMLQGQAGSQEEKDIIAERAAQVVGPDNVSDQLVVAP